MDDKGITGITGSTDNTGITVLHVVIKLRVNEQIDDRITNNNGGTHNEQVGI